MKHNRLHVVAVTVLLTLLTGCSSSDEASSNKQDGPLVIDGVTLPADPGEIGKSTLLGVDSNENGVRDDVEIYIYKRFRGFENAKKDRAIAMQYARATQVIIQEPEKAYENKSYMLMHDAIDCKWYYFNRQLEDITTYKERLNYRQKHRIYDAEMEDVIFNTPERIEAYFQYNASLGGNIFHSRPALKEKCDVNIDTLGFEG